MMPSREVHSLTGCPEDGDGKVIVHVGNYTRMYVRAVMSQNATL